MIFLSGSHPLVSGLRCRAERPVLRLLDSLQQLPGTSREGLTPYATLGLRLKIWSFFIKVHQVSSMVNRDFFFSWNHEKPMCKKGGSNHRIFRGSLWQNPISVVHYKRKSVASAETPVQIQGEAGEASRRFWWHYWLAKGLVQVKTGFF